MADIKWIKITTDIFDDDKILLIESLPDADAIIVIWFKLLCLAGKQNNSGVFLLNDRIPYTDKMLATIFRRKESTVQLALQTFEQFGMIEVVDGVITIPNWGKHQNLDALENKKAYMREYMKEYRAKQKLLVGSTKYNEAGLSIEDWKTVLTEFDYECAYCGSKDGLEQDHAIPFADGGQYVIGNIVPACRRCNASKGDKEVFSWYEAQEFFDSERCKHLRKYLRKSKVSRLDKNREEKIREEENTPLNPPAGEIDDSHVLIPFVGELQEAFDDWLAYKKEKRQPYKPRGLKSLVTQVERYAEQFGEAETANAIRNSMASNYQGIVFDRIGKGDKSGSKDKKTAKAPGEYRGKDFFDDD